MITGSWVRIPHMLGDSIFVPETLVLSGLSCWWIDALLTARVLHHGPTHNRCSSPSSQGERELDTHDDLCYCLARLAYKCSLYEWTRALRSRTRSKSQRGEHECFPIDQCLPRGALLLSALLDPGDLQRLIRSECTSPGLSLIQFQS